ncbi:hypothetical protein BY458DRAFT_524926 [Sporodiniella umbellata]|nr:hypothetical protein BY458DRAFT_524926 [Sporodiniella umbellata]
MKDDLSSKSQWFNPPLWRQRRLFIVETLERFRPQSVLDYGCGEASVLSFLISSNEAHIKKMAGIDICEEALEEAAEACRPWASDYTQQRASPLEITIYKGSVSIPDDRLKEYEAIVCSEVIEHLHDQDLLPFLDVTLGFYKPRILIVTTPNSEFNVHFPELRYGTDLSVFRHDDHKFEWTREQFQNWCQKGADKFGYRTEFHGIGLLRDENKEAKYGHCTQACIFIRKNKHSAHFKKAGEAHSLFCHFEFPFYNEPLKPPAKILQEIHTFIETLCLSDFYAQKKNEKKIKIIRDDSFDLDDFVDWNTFDIKEKESQFIPQSVQTQNHGSQRTKTPVEIPILQLWDIIRIQRLCETLERLIILLSENQDPLIYTVQKDILIVHKAFEIP